MIGVVLAGGAGRRLGRVSKSAALLGGRPLIEYPLSALSRVCELLAVVCKSGTRLPELPGAERWEQPDRPRQDVKHVTMLGLCVPHFLEDVRAQATDRVQQRSVLSKYIATLAALKNTYSGRQFEAQHPGAIHWQKIISQRVQQMPFDQDVQNSLRQLTGVGHSRGIGI